ncbi:hypothetical protein [Gracilibacillus sp. YIM 98692]|uniref:GbsR/MarR family transcriptional regulator n=1 Tax=Gracilibacillus sp. YIM 98692 TaxID=2663532 RepID=UPI001F0989EE|nr:hypothetical protein [Gracilibacillus sp. YIM 98692]
MTNQTPDNEILDDINNKIISEFSKTLEMFSLNQTESKLFVTLYLTAEPMTLDEMKDVLGKSKTAMSYAVRTLLDYNLVERVWRKGVRKDLYQAKQNLYEKFMKTYVNRWLEALDQQINSLGEIQQELGELQNGEKELVDHKIHEAITFHRSLEDVFQRIKENDF